MGEPADIPEGLDGFEESRCDMVRRQIEARGIHTEAVLRAMRAVPRHLFVPPHMIHRAYDDAPVDIGCEQTVSQPYIVALMTEALELAGTERVLEIGTGSGYQTAILARLAAGVWSVERQPELAEAARALLAELGCGNVSFDVGDGTLGWPGQAPYDRIIVTACAPRIPPTLLGQLVGGGIMVIPLGSYRMQTLYKITKRTDAELDWLELCPCLFVPLVGQEGF